MAGSNQWTNALRGFGHTLAALSTNCSEFHEAWDASTSAPPDGIEGRWSGEWVSRENGHRGSLKCLLTRLDSTHVRAQIHATYASFLRVCYTVVLETDQEGKTIRFRGETDLGKLAGGVYRYNGLLENDQLHSTYQCAYDQGDFVLARTPP